MEYSQPQLTPREPSAIEVAGAEIAHVMCADSAVTLVYDAVMHSLNSTAASGYADVLLEESVLSYYWHRLEVAKRQHINVTIQTLRKSLGQEHPPSPFVAPPTRTTR